MHIHHSPASSPNAGVHSAAAAEKAAAAARAAETRRKLLKSSAQIEAGLDAREVFMVRGWSDGNHGAHREKPAPRPQQHPPAEEDESAVKPISLWA